MNLDTFKLASIPFGPCAGADLVYVGTAQRSALAALSQSLSETGSLTVLAAPAGYGKSTLIDWLAGDLGERILWSRVRGPYTDPTEFLRAVILGFGFDECSGTRDQLRHILDAFLTHQWQRQDVPALIIDDAQDLKPQTIEELRWLAALKEGNHAALNIILSGLPELNAIVHSQVMEPLTSGRLRVVEIDGMGEADTGAYILHRLASAGAEDPGHVFEEAAVSLIYRYTGGIPALVNTLSQSAMNCAAAAGQSQVTKTTVVNALGQLHCVPSAGVDINDATGGEAEKANKGADLGHLIVTKANEQLIDYSIVKERVLIGRRPDSDLQLNSLGVSRYHALMLLDREGWLLIDLHSLNGTYVNSRHAQQHRLASGDVIQIADLEIRCLHQFASKAPPLDSEEDGTLVFDSSKLQRSLPRGARPRLVKSS